MKKTCFNLLTAGACVAGVLASGNQSAMAEAVITYNSSGQLYAINGSGNADTGWNILQDRDAGGTGTALELGFMAEYSKPGYPNNATASADPNNGLGTFVFPQGNQSAIGGSASRSQFDLWFSVNTKGTALADSGLDFYWSILPPGSSTWTTPINLLSYVDSSYGTGSTGDGGGIVGTASTSADLQSTYSVVQNAQDPIWIDPSYDVNGSGIIDVEIFAVDHGDAGVIGNAVDTLTGQVQVGVVPVPEPSPLAFAGLGSLALLGINRIRRKS